MKLCSCFLLGGLFIGILLGCFFASMAYKPLIREVHNNVVFYKTQYEHCEGAVKGFEVAIQGHTQDMILFKKESTLMKFIDQRALFILMMKELDIYNQAIYLENKMKKEMK